MNADASTNANYLFGFTYDNIGNRDTYASSESGNPVQSNYTTNNLNQYTAITNPTLSPTYDDDGNMTSDGVWTYTWNCENRLIGSEKVEDTKLEFAYDYMGRRVQKKVYSWTGSIWQLDTHLKFVYDDYKLIEVLDGANSDAILQKFVWNGELPFSIYDASLNTTYYFLLDANKNVSELVDASGNVVAHYEYTPNGKISSQTGSYADNTPIRFSSEYFDNETGLIYYNFRYLNPKLGRWINRDPISEYGGNNLYCFMSNAGVISWDYLGLMDADEVREWVIKTISDKSLRKKYPTAVRFLQHWFLKLGGTVDLTEKEIKYIFGSEQGKSAMGKLDGKMIGWIKFKNPSVPIGFRDKIHRHLKGSPNYGGEGVMETFPTTSLWDSNEASNYFFAFHNIYFDAEYDGEFCKKDKDYYIFTGTVTYRAFDTYVFQNRAWGALGLFLGGPLDSDMYKLQQSGQAKSFNIEGFYEIKNKVIDYKADAKSDEKINVSPANPSIIY